MGSGAPAPEGAGGGGAVVDEGGTEAQARLRAHVAALAGSIGERHVLRPWALAAAAVYVAGQ